MSALTTTDVWILLGVGWAVMVGYCVGWHFSERSRAARLSRAETAFWSALT